MADGGCHEVVLSADEVRVAAQLLDTLRQVQSWAEIVDVDMAAAAPAETAVQHRIVSAISRAVADRLLPGDAEARVKAATTSDRAIEAYRRGQRGERRSPRAALEAIEAFSLAVRIDPEVRAPLRRWPGARASRAMLDGRDASSSGRARGSPARVRPTTTSRPPTSRWVRSVLARRRHERRRNRRAAPKALGAAAGDQLARVGAECRRPRCRGAAASSTRP